MQLHRLTRPDLIFPNLEGQDVSTILRSFSKRIEEAGVVKDAGELFDRLREREQLGSTGIGFSVAIPHCKLPGIDNVLLAIATSREGVDFAAVDGEPVRLFFLVLSPVKDPAGHLKSLAAISKWVKADRHIERILELGRAEEIHELLKEDDESL